MPYDPTTAAALASWGANDEMNPLEAVMWRAEVEPRLRSTVLSIELLDTAPDWSRLVAAHEWGVAAVPRARQRVLEPPAGLGTPTWVDDPDFDLAYHLRRTVLPGHASTRDLLDLAQTIAMTPFDRSRPLWEMTVVEGLPEGRAAFVSKMHHSTTDGLGGMQLIALGRSTDRDHTPDKPIAAAAPARSPVSPIDLAFRQARNSITETPKRLLRNATTAAALSRNALTDPAASLESAIRYADSLRRVVGKPPAPGSPLLAGRSSRWHFEIHEVPLASLKAAAEAADASLNDAYIAALLGAFRLYHERAGMPIDTMPIAFPISLRRGDDPLGGNRFAGARLAGPAGEPDPRARIRRVRHNVLRVRAEPAITALDQLSSALLYAPTPILTPILLGLGKDNDLQASNVPGVPHPVYLAGAEVLRLYPFGPLPGCASMITLVSHNGTCCIGVNLDPAAITDPASFVECLVDGFDEVIALAT